MKNDNFLIVGNDLKMKGCADCLNSSGYESELCTGELLSKLSNYKNVILPLPTATDGIICGTDVNINDLSERLQKGQRVFYGNLNNNPFGENGYCYYTDDDFIKYNARLTAQGVLKLILDNIFTDITTIKICVLGYGRCGEAICSLLEKNKIDVTVFSRRRIPDRNSESFAQKWRSIYDINSVISSFDIIINTIPYNVISEEGIKSLNYKNMYIEVASKPFGFNISSIEYAHFKYIKANSLPGRFTPASAGKNIAETVINIIKEGEYG